MSAVLVSKENNQAVFTAEISPEDFNKAIETAYRKNRHHFTIPGFRKGKAPRRLLEANYGEGLFYEDALNEALPDLYDNAVEELGLYPVAHPDVDVDEMEKGKSVKIKFTVDLKPEPKVGDYKGAEVKVRPHAIHDEDVDRHIEADREANARIVPVEREIQDGDIVTLDYKGFVGDEAFEGGEAQDQDLTIGSGQFIPGFEEKLVGHKVGEEFSIDVTFPEEYHEELAGKDARFDIVIKEVKEKQLPEADDDLAMDVSDFDTMDEYKKDIRKNLEIDVENRKRIERENAAVEKLVEVSEIDIPESMIDHQIDHEVQDMEREMAQMGLGMEQYMQILQKSMDDVRAELRPRAEQRLKADLLLEQLVEDLAIEVEDSEIEDKINEYAEQLPEEQRDEYLKFVMESQKESVGQSLKVQKAIEKMMEDMNFVEAEDEPVEVQEVDVEENEEEKKNTEE